MLTEREQRGLQIAAVCKLTKKDDTAQVNEVLCKVLCHNICVLVQSIHELGIEPAFCAEMSVAQKVPA